MSELLFGYKSNKCFHYYILGFFFVVTILIHWVQLKLTEKSIAKFARIHMLITFFKLVLYSVVAIIYIAIDSANALPFVICLMLLYLTYTFFEVVETTRISRSDQERKIYFYENSYELAAN